MRDEIKVGSEWRNRVNTGWVVQIAAVEGGRAELTWHEGGAARESSWSIRDVLDQFNPIAPAPREVPAHYAGSIEPRDAIDAWGLGYNLGNVVKYVARCDRKGDPLGDLRKALDYLNHEYARRAKGG